MSQLSKQPTTPAPPYDYDHAFAVIAAIQRAVASPDFHAGILYGYTQSGRPEAAKKFTAAVEEQRAFAAADAAPAQAEAQLTTYVENSVADALGGPR